MNRPEALLAGMLTPYDVVKSIAQFTNGVDLYNLGKTSDHIWRQCRGHLQSLTNTDSFGVKCNGTGIYRWHGHRTRMFQPRGPYFQCLDRVSNVTTAKPCEECEVEVCNVCRFHLYRTVDRSSINGPDWRFEEEIEPDSNTRTEWQHAGYCYQAGAQDLATIADNLLACSVLVYCNIHVEEHKLVRRTKLQPKRLPGPLCTCTPYDLFVGRWLCIPCFERKRAGMWDRDRNRNRMKCCQGSCNRPADTTWKQCLYCEKLKVHYQPKGFNAVQRTED